MVYPHTVCGWVHDPGGLYKELDFPWLYPVNPGTRRKYISTYVLIVVTLISRVLLYIVFCEFQYNINLNYITWFWLCVFFDDLKSSKLLQILYSENYTIRFAFQLKNLKLIRDHE